MLNSRAISCPVTVPLAGSSIWMKSAPAAARTLSSSLMTWANSAAISTVLAYTSPGRMREAKVSGPAQVTLVGRSVCACRYSNSSTMPSPEGASIRPVAT